MADLEKTMTIDDLKMQIPDTAKDIRLNLGSVLVVGESGLTASQLWGTALAVAYAIGNPNLTTSIFNEGAEALSDEIQQAAEMAAALMAMNNIYYRALHLIEDKELSALPARLRMNALGNPGIDKKDFELMCLAISAINGCGMCLQSHANTLKKEGITSAMIQHALKIAAVLNATVCAIRLKNGH
jgi:alkyl hydroperoxide reductase subunit D